MAELRSLVDEIYYPMATNNTLIIRYAMYNSNDKYDSHLLLCVCTTLSYITDYERTHENMHIIYNLVFNKPTCMYIYV